MSKTVYLQYQIFLTDEDQVATLQAANPTGIIMAPTVAATTYSAPLLLGAGEPFKAPCTASAWFLNHDENFPLDQRTFERCKGGWFGICGLFGDRTTYFWRGTFVFSAAVDPLGVESPIKDEPPVAFAQRRWIDGFELPLDGEGGGHTLSSYEVARAASRHIQGYGLLLDSATTTHTHTPVESGGAAINEQWERFYFRFRRFPTALSRLWRVETVTGTGNYVEIGVLPTGQLVVSNNYSTTNEILATTVALPIHTWKRIDLIYRFAHMDAAIPGFLQIFINGVLTVNVVSAGPGAGTDRGLGTTSNISKSTIGTPAATTGLVWNIDDWVGAALPTPATRVRTGTTVNTGQSITGISSLAQVVVGMYVSGAGIVSGTKVQSLDSPSKITITIAATASATVSLTFTSVTIFPGYDWNNGSRVGLIGASPGEVALMGVTSVGTGIVTGLSATSGLAAGMTAVGTGIPAATTIASVDSSTQITLSASATAAGDVLITFAFASGFASDHSVNWVGDWRLARQRPVDTQSLTSLDSSTASAKLSIRTDAAREIDGQVNSIGIVALTVGLFSKRVGAATAQLGYKFPGGPDVYVTITPDTFYSWKTTMVRPSATVNPISPVAGLELKHQKDTAATAANVRALMAVAEMVGIFGQEDVPPVDAGHTQPQTIPAFSSLHNAPYPHSPWARRGAAPISPVSMHGRLYTGNSTFQDLAFRNPLCFLWIRRITTAGEPPMLWISSANGPHTNLNKGYHPLSPVEVLIDPQFVGGVAEDDQETQTLVRIVGANASGNLNLAVYQVIAIADPGMRFFLASALYNHDGANDLVTTLDNEAFVPDAVLAILEEANSAASNGVYFKGLGHSATAISPLNATEVASGLAMGTGTVTYKSGIAVGSTNQIPFLAMRRSDKSNDPGAVRVTQFASYTGDGSASRTISLAPISGRRPLFGLVVPHNAASVQRDPSHTGTTSTTLPATANPSTGITGGGLDSISVGSALNANGILYDVWVIPGSEAACNNGWGCNGDFDPVPPDTPFDPGPWDPEPPDPNAPIVPPPGPPPDGSEGPDFGTDCIGPSTKIINQALVRIGVSKQIGNVTTELSPEADVARLQYADAVTSVLRDFPWPFATKYTAPVLVAGTAMAPLNPDWTFSYRRPADCVFERRLVAARNGAVDPTPPPFQLSSDTTGGLILTNEATPQLEYTYRPGCSAGLGDPLFKEALTWKVAGAMAPALSRMAGIVEHCEAQYQQAIARATLNIKPGNPGAPPAAPTIDTAAASQAANVRVVNWALIRIGAQTITNLTTDQSREAQAVRLIFEDELQSVLRDFPWGFATKYATPTVVGGTAATAVNGDWQYSYRLPTDAVFVRRPVTALKRAYDKDTPTFHVSRDATGQLLFTNQTPAVIEYTARLDGVVALADAVFRDAFAWRLAASLAPSLAQIDPSKPEQQGRGPNFDGKDPARITRQMRENTAQWAWRMYQFTLSTAKKDDANEQQQDRTNPDADWIVGR